MNDKTNSKVTISAEPITIPAAQFLRLLRAAVHCEYLMKQKRIDEEKIHRMRTEPKKYQTICENRKKASGAGASEEPQATETDADETKTDAVELTIGTEGRVSGGDRALSDIERAHFAKLEEEYIALAKKQNELKEKLEDARHMQAVANENSTAFQKRLVTAERCIEDIEHVLYGVEDYVAAVGNVRNLIGAWRKEREAK